MSLPYKTLAGSQKTAPEGKKLRECAGNKRLFASIQSTTAAPPRRISRLLKRVASGKRAPLTMVELEQTLGTRFCHEVQITQAARAAGLKVEPRSHADRIHGIIPVSGTYARFKSFSDGLVLHEYEDKKGNKVIGREGTLSVPKGLPIVGLFGLDDREVAHTNYHIHKPKGNHPHAVRGMTSRGLARLQGWDLADMDKTVRVTGYISLGGDNVKIQDDLKTLAREEGIKSSTVINVSTDGTKNGAYDDDATGENVLDLLAQALLNPNGYVIAFNAANSDDSFAGAAEAAIAHAGVKHGSTTLKLSALTISWGMAESANTPQTLQRWERIATAARLAGIDIFAATGDDGPDDRSSAPTPDAPSSVPGIFGAAGVGIESSDGKTVTAIFPWDDSKDGGGETGFGISSQFPPMPEESGLNLPASAVTGKAGHSASVFADISQPASGPIVLWRRQRPQIGGTSHSAPFQGAKVSYLKVKHGIPVFLSFAYTNGASIVDRITQGDSEGPYPADPARAYNVMTGFGVLNGAKVGSRK
jgi:hypothetical protein